MSTGRESTEYERIQYGPGARPEEIEYQRVQYEPGTRPEEMTAGMRERAMQAQHQMRGQGEKAKDSVASGMHVAAERLRQQGQQGGQPQLTSRVADPLERGSQYLESHSLPQIGDDVRRNAMERPWIAAAGVFTVAFLAGRLLRRR